MHNNSNDYTWSINDGDKGISRNTTLCADEKSSPTPPAVIPIIAIFTWWAKKSTILVQPKRYSNTKLQEKTDDKKHATRTFRYQKAWHKD